MDEGWADWLGMMLTIDPDDLNGQRFRKLGEWLKNGGSENPSIILRYYDADT